MTLHFTPRAIQAYNATLTAEVEDGSDPRTRAFSCELKGEGSLPTLTLQVRRRLAVLKGLEPRVPKCSQSKRGYVAAAQRVYPW